MARVKNWDRAQGAPRTQPAEVGLVLHAEGHHFSYRAIEQRVAAQLQRIQARRKALTTESAEN